MSNVSIVPVNDKERIKSYWIGAVQVCTLLQADDKETVEEAEEKIKLIKQSRKHYENKTPAMDLVSAIEKAKARSLKLSKNVFIGIDPDTGECEITLKQDSQSTHAFNDGNEVPLQALQEKETKKDMETVIAKTKVAAKKTAPAKKTAAKVAPAKKKVEPKVLKPSGKHPFKDGQKVTYDGKKFEVKRAYFYNGRPLCIISDGAKIKSKQVSASTLK